MTDPRVLMERDDATGIARITLNNPERRNCYDPPMREQLGEYLDELAIDDARQGRVAARRGRRLLHRRRHGQRVQLVRDATMTATSDASGRAAEPAPPARGRPQDRSASTTSFMGYPKATVAEVRGFALGGGFELALMADIAVVARDAVIGMPATRFLGPALGSLHLFFHRLGPVLARRLLLTGDTVPASDRRAPRRVHRGRRRRRGRGRAPIGGRRRSPRCPPTGSSWPRRRSASSSSCRRTRARKWRATSSTRSARTCSSRTTSSTSSRCAPQHGTKRAFELRDAHFDVPEPD